MFKLSLLSAIMLVLACSHVQARKHEAGQIIFPPVIQYIDVVSDHVQTKAQEYWQGISVPMVEKIKTDGNDYCGFVRLNSDESYRFIALEHRAAIVIYWEWAQSHKDMFYMQWNSLCSDMFPHK